MRLGDCANGRTQKVVAIVVNPQVMNRTAKGVAVWTAAEWGCASFAAHVKKLSDEDTRS
jgi:hypothetical protein